MNVGKLCFPGKFTFKIVGWSKPEFAAEITKIFQLHFPHFSQDAIKLNPSRNNQYLAMSITVTADSQFQLDTTYSLLSHHEQVLFVL